MGGETTSRPKPADRHWSVGWIVRGFRVVQCTRSCASSESALARRYRRPNGNATTKKRDGMRSVAAEWRRGRPPEPFPPRFIKVHYRQAYIELLVHFLSFTFARSRL